MAQAHETSLIGSNSLDRALGRCNSESALDSILFASCQGDRELLACGAEGHGDDDEDEDDQDQDEDEEDDEDEDEEEPWQVRSLTGCQAQARTAGRPPCAPFRPAALRSRRSRSRA